MQHSVLKVKTSKLKNIKEYILVGIIIMFTDSLWIRNITVNRFILLMVMSVFIFLYLNKRISKNNKNWLIFFSSAICISMCFNLSINMLYIFKIAIIIITWSILNSIDLETILNKYISIMIFISIFSLVCMVFRNEIIKMDFIKTIDEGTYGTKLLFFSTVKCGSGNILFWRNQGPFWEPGVYQAYLALALIFLLFYVKRKHQIKEMIILIITIVSTFSTTGYIVLAIILCAYIVGNDNSKKGSKIKILMVIIGTGTLCIALNSNEVNSMLFDKLSSSSISSVSANTRIYSIFKNVEAILENPVTGIGPERFAEVFANTVGYFEVVDANVNTTTSLCVWALYGIGYFVLFNYGIFKFIIKSSNNFIVLLLLNICMLIILNTENWNYSLMINMIALGGFCRKRHK